MRLLKLVPIIIVIFGFFSCSSVSVKHDYDPGIDFSTYKTYRFYDKAIKGDALSKNQLLKKRVLSSLDKVLTEKGFIQTDDNVDFIVVAQAGIKDRMQITHWGGYGWYRPGWGTYGHTDVSYYEEGNLVINVVDTKKKELAWRGVATGTLKDYSDKEEMQKNLDNIVAKILQDFPPTEK
jgi:hypothetical protein